MSKVSFAPDEWWPVLGTQDTTYNDDWDIEVPDEELAAFKAAELAFAKASIAIANRLGIDNLFWADDIVRRYEEREAK